MAPGTTDSDSGAAMRDWGWVDDAELERVVVLSPHCDDAVLSCGQLLSRHPGVTVITVFCGTPASYPDPPNAWSQLSRVTATDDSAAFEQYPSQVRALESDWAITARLDAPTPEQYWRLAPPPPGWEIMVEL